MQVGPHIRLERLRHGIYLFIFVPAVPVHECGCGYKTISTQARQTGSRSVSSCTSPKIAYRRDESNPADNSNGSINQVVCDWFRWDKISRSGRVISVNDSFDRITKQHSVNDKQFKEDLLSILGLVLRCRTRSRRALRTMRTEQEKLNDSSTQEHLIKSPDSQYIDEQLQGISQDSGSLHRFIITLDTFKGSNGSVPCLSDALSFFTNTSPFNRKRSHSMMVKEEIG